MFDQTFAVTDLPKLLFLIFLEIILSADNAIVLGVLASRLPEKLRIKALYIGAVSAFFIRAFALLILGLIVQYRWVRVIGAVYLLFISGRFFFSKKKKPLTAGTSSFWKIVILIEFFDLVFAIDSILAGVAMISSENPHHFSSKIWIVYVGGMIGLMGIRYAAHLFSSIILRFPRMESSAHLLISLIGLKLVLELFPEPPFFDPIFWGVFVIVFLLGFTRGKKKYG